MKSRYAMRTDENQTVIVAAMRYIGATVTILRQGEGIADLLVSFRGSWFVIEVKNPSKPKRDQELTEEEKKWIEEQKAPVHIVFSPAQAIDVLRNRVLA